MPPIPAPARLNRIEQFKRFVLKKGHEARGWLQQAEQNGNLIRPRRQLVKLAVFIFLGFCVFAALAIAKPDRAVLLACGIPYGIVYICFIMWLTYDLYGNKDEYNRNRTTTTFIAVLTPPALAALYIFSWNGPLNNVVLQLTQDNVSFLNYPAVALLQDVNWSSQANLLDSKSKCYLGWLNQSAPTCNSLDLHKFAPAGSCSCQEHWTPKVQSDFYWKGPKYRYLEFHPPPELINTTPSQRLFLQAFFNFNASASLYHSSQTKNPSLWMVVFDRDLSLQEALQTNYATMINIGANADVFVNLGAVYRRPLDAKPAYEYTVSVSTNPNLELVCNSSPQVQSSWPCHITLYVQFPTFQRQIVTERKEMRWTDALAAAGSFFALIQLCSWLVSGQAIGP